MSFPTSNPTLYPDKALSPRGQSGSAWEHPDGGLVREEIIRIEKAFYCTQTVVMKSSGNTVFAPTWQGATPTNVLPIGRSAIAWDMLNVSCVPAVLTATGIVLQHGSGPNDASAFFTVFYA